MGRGGINNANLDVVCAKVEELGGTVSDVHLGRKHLRVNLRTREGAAFTMTLSQSTIDSFKQAGWTRQAYNRANARSKP